MFTNSLIKTICLTVGLAVGLSLHGGTASAGGPLPNNENLRGDGLKADLRFKRNLFGQPEDFEVESNAQRRNTRRIWKAPAGSKVATTMGGTPDGIKAARRASRAK